MMRLSTGNLLTWWEAPERALRVECANHQGAFRVTTLCAGHVTAERRVESERRARALFERVVEAL
jgi:hypothetical protein